jgi:hypothetical protein
VAASKKFEIKKNSTDLRKIEREREEESQELEKMLDGFWNDMKNKKVVDDFGLSTLFEDDDRVGVRIPPEPPKETEPEKTRSIGKEETLITPTYEQSNIDLKQTTNPSSERAVVYKKLEAIFKDYAI